VIKNRVLPKEAAELGGGLVGCGAAVKTISSRAPLLRAVVLSREVARLVDAPRWAVERHHKLPMLVAAGCAVACHLVVVEKTDPNDRAQHAEKPRVFKTKVCR